MATKTKVKSKQAPATESKSKNKAPKTLTGQFIEIFSQREKLWFEECILAYKIAVIEKEWEKMGYLSIKEYVDEELAHKLKISYTRFMEKVKIGEIIDIWGFHSKELIEIGSSKFRTLATLLNLENYTGEDLEQVINDIKNQTVEEAKDTIKNYKLRYVSGEAKPKSLSLSFKLLEDQADIVKHALDKVKELTGFEDLNQALVYICTEFLMNYNEDVHEIEQIKAEVERLSNEAEPPKKVKGSKHNYSGRKK